MSVEGKPESPPANGESTAGRNLERLLAAAYRPEGPSVEFARRLQVAAQQRATRRKETPDMVECTAGEHEVPRVRLCRIAGWGLAAAAAVAVVAALVLQHGESKPQGANRQLLAPLLLSLPKPMFEGTPKALKGYKLAKPRAEEPFMAPEGCTNVALNKPVKSSDPEPTVGELKQVTDGDKEAVEGSYIELGPGVQWVQIDLQGVYNIYATMLWHFHKEARVYRAVVVQVADDPDFITNVRTVFNNDSDNSAGLGAGTDLQYLDEYTGKLIDPQGVKARYVRCYSKGNSSNDQNHYTEVEVYGIPAR